MNFIEVSIFILFFAVISVPITLRFHIPHEVFLVIGSCIISFIPGLPPFQIDPLIVFNLFLPPILFHAAFYTSVRELNKYRRVIGFLAIGLVIVTTITVAVAAKWLFPAFSWMECFLLGAIVSPTDASSATSVIRKLGAPKRIIGILEGESLINDATALILFRFSLAAMLIGSFSMGEAIGQFFIVAAGGFLVGLIIAPISEFIIKHLNSVSAEITLSFVTAFACYIIAEHLGFSGVIATVVAGLYFGIHIPAHATSQTRMQAKASWNTAIFVINCFAFTLIGLELPMVLKSLHAYYSISILIFYGILISMVIIIIRIICIFGISYISRLLFSSINKNDPIHIPSIFILGWSGMRGIVSLAAVLSIPYQLKVGVLFPYRDLLLFITYIVIIVTLVIPTLTLPFLLYFLKMTDASSIKDEARARLRVLEGILNNLDEIVRLGQVSEKIIKEFQEQINRRIQLIQTQLNDSPYSNLSEDYVAFRRLLRIAFDTERKILVSLRKNGEMSDDIFYTLSDELDLEELRANTLRV